MTMPRIYIHIGLHKTATTTLQKEFFSTCDNLNVLVRNSPPEFSEFIDAVCCKDPIYFDDARAFSLLKPFLKEDIPNLLTAEDFSGAVLAGAGKPGLDHRSSIIQNLKSVFPEARIILVIRRQGELAKSMYRQYLKFGGTEGVYDFYGLTGGKPVFSMDRFLFKPYVDAIHNTFSGQVLVLTYEEFCSDTDSFLAKLASYIGASVPTIQLSRRNPTRVGPVGMWFSRFFSHFFRTQLNPGGLLPGLPRFVQGKFTWYNPIYFIHDHWPNWGSIKHSHKVEQVCHKIMDMVREDNKELDNKYDLSLSKYQYWR